MQRQQALLGGGDRRSAAGGAAAATTRASRPSVARRVTAAPTRQWPFSSNSSSMAAAAASRSGANHAAPLLAASSSSFSSLQQRRRWASSPSPRLLRARASSPGQEGEGEGEVYEVKESEDDLWAAIALPVTMSSAEGQQVEYLVLDTDGALAEPAIESYLGQLQAERSAEAAALEGAKSEAAARGGGGGDDWALDPTLLKRMATVRDAERGLIVQELMYLLCIKRLKDEGLTIVTDLGDAAPSGLSKAAKAPGDEVDLNNSNNAMGRRMEQLMPLVSLPVADSILGYVGATVTNSMRLLAKDTPLSIDRVQAARLYGGMLEFGYFSRCLEAECLKRGISIGGDSATMIKLADSLPEDELRSMCTVQTADGWYSAVRHVGGLFKLRPNPDLQFDSCALPYKALSATISDIVLEPASAIGEHYSPPGTAAELQDKAKKKADRGWKVDPSETTPELPEADLVTFQVGEFAGLLIEAAVMGCLFWEAEKKVQSEFGYPLESKAARAQHVEATSGEEGGDTA